MNTPKFSIVILTFNRPNEVKRNVSEILSWKSPECEIIVVDNNSDVPADELLLGLDVQILRMDKNIGIGGRNIGISQAKADIIITLDDDVFGLKPSHLDIISEKFLLHPNLGAMNFRIIDDETERQVNWCHHRKIEEWAFEEFETYEISEGAVAFRSTALEKSGLYPEKFFISHEGPDLALRLMGKGYSVEYTHNVVVRHSHAVAGRPSWRRYYYDTRNAIWLALRCYNLSMAAKKVPLALASLLVYSLRDGYFRYWIKAIWDALLCSPTILKTRVSLPSEVWQRCKSIEKYHPSVIYMVKRRLSKKGVRI